MGRKAKYGVKTVIFTRRVPVTLLDEIEILVDNLLSKCLADNIPDSLNGFIYKITNSKTNLIYIGQTIRNPTTRWYEHIISKGETKINNAFKEFSVTDFTFEIIEEVSHSSLNKAERKWIEFYNSRELGYNSGSCKAKNKINIDSAVWDEKAKSYIGTVPKGALKPGTEISTEGIILKSKPILLRLSDECDCVVDEKGLLRRGKSKCTKSKEEHKF